VPTYLVETYLGQGLPGERSVRAERARLAADELTLHGVPVRFERSIHVPGDELCFFVFDAPDGQTAALVAERARLNALRVVAAQCSDNVT
jgi:hypothetical protein